MNRKSILSILLALTMLFSLSVCAGASASAETSTSTAEQQLSLISSKIDSLEQKDSANTWYYTVADLDHEKPCLRSRAAIGRREKIG